MNEFVTLSVIGDSNVYLVNFTRTDRGPNILDIETLDELEDRLKRIAGDTGTRGVVFASAHPATFIADADLRYFSELKSKEDWASYIRRGQRVFGRIASLQCVTVSAIHGACTGSGFELALACDYRIASPDRITQTGLPQVDLGLIPFWGGTTRLPRIIKLPDALDFIMYGHILAPTDALAAGFVDELIPREHLQRIALEYISRGKPKRPARFRLTSPRADIQQARAAWLAETRGAPAAPGIALEVVEESLTRSVAYGLEAEAHAAMELALTDTRENLTRLHLAKARALSIRERQVRRMAVIGAGALGADLAHWAGLRGISVLLQDVNAERNRAGMQSASELAAASCVETARPNGEARHGVERIAPADESAPLRGMDIVIECATEDLALKTKLIEVLAARTGDRSVIATTTSTLSVSDLAASARRPERVVGLHFFRPMSASPVVEVVTPRSAAPEAIRAAVAFARQLEKIPVVVKDTPGFVVHRILTPYLLEAARLFERGFSADTIDDAMLSFGMEIGPLRWIDEVGVARVHRVCAELARCYHYEIPNVLAELAESKPVGRGTERGFYVHAPDGTVSPNPAARRPKRARAHPDELQRRMVLRLLNEAARCASDHVVESNGEIDFAIVLAAGFPAFRGGPLRYAESQGIAEIQEELARRAKDDDQFTPCSLLTQMAIEGGSFF